MERQYGAIGSGGYAADASTAIRDKTQIEVVTDRLRATVSRMADYNSTASASLDRLCGGGGLKGDTAQAQPPMPTDFVGAATAILDEIGRELGRMESNCQRLSRVA